ncbi:hypothetical protein EVAR_62531_1 [Eumeta japonica]|uniref:Secreted protein n=1 Tax=Eumeta variegata TaxID=151549 RepID=A0A4C1T4W2_EUMVA|nr:hypothetical protein EVAR_62531_1 [Eumeta japonica]
MYRAIKHPIITFIFASLETLISSVVDEDTTPISRTYTFHFLRAPPVSAGDRLVFSDFVVRSRRAMPPVTEENIVRCRKSCLYALHYLPLTTRFHANQVHPQEIADSHIHQGVRSVKKPTNADSTSLSEPRSCKELCDPCERSHAHS